MVDHTTTADSLKTALGTPSAATDSSSAATDSTSVATDSSSVVSNRPTAESKLLATPNCFVGTELQCATTSQLLTTAYTTLATYHNSQALDLTTLRSTFPTACSGGLSKFNFQATMQGL